MGQTIWIKDAYKERIGILEKTYEQVIAIGIAKHDTFKAEIKPSAVRERLNEISQVKTALSESPRIHSGGDRNKTGSDKPDKLI
jgi:hypothetical protein